MINFDYYNNNRKLTTQKGERRMELRNHKIIVSLITVSILTIAYAYSLNITDLQAENQRLQAQMQENLRKIALLQQQASDTQPVPAPVVEEVTEVKTTEVSELPSITPEQARERLNTIERQVRVMQEGVSKDNKRIQNYEKLLNRYQSLIGRTRSRRSRGIYQKKIKQFTDKINFLRRKMEKDDTTIQGLEEEAERIG